jgi:hypothetical protein
VETDKGYHDPRQRLGQRTCASLCERPHYAAFTGVVLGRFRDYQLARSGDAARCPELWVLREEMFDTIEDVDGDAFCAVSCSAICARSEMRSWIDSGDHMSVIHPMATDAHGSSPTMRPIP